MKYEFAEVFSDVTKNGRKIASDEYLKYGKYPIIDQGKDFVAGYSNEGNRLYTDVPAIIFGDHTRILKFVTEPCFLGADGVKLLKSKFHDCNDKYLFYALKSIKIPNTGYNRHFKWLKASKIDLPDRKTQDFIVNVLDNIELLIHLKMQQADQFDVLVKSRFVEMFGDIKDTCKLGDYIESLIAGKSLAGDEEYKNKVLKSGAVSFDYFDGTQVKDLPVDYEPEEKNRVKVGDLLISRMNTAELTGAAAYVWHISDNVYLPDRLWKAVLKNDCNPIFLWQMMIQYSTKEQIRRKCSGTSGSMKNISKVNMLDVNVKNISIDLQNQFADFVQQVDKSKLAVQKSLDELEILKKSLMQQYFG